jgi:hypothetical protein
MKKRFGVAGRASSPLTILALAVLLASCDDDTPTGSNPPTTTTAPSSSASAFLRAAPLAFDAHTVDVVISGANGDDTINGVPYPGVSDYLELSPGDFRVQFFPVGSRRAALAEASVALSDAQAVTVALVGLSAFDIAVLEDDRVDGSSSAGVTMTNGIPDFPAPLDLVILNGPVLLQGVAYLETSDATEAVPGRYDLQIRRAGTDEPVATSTGHDFAAGVTYTVFAVGSLTRGDIGIVVANDVP